MEEAATGVLALGLAWSGLRVREAPVHAYDEAQGLNICDGPHPNPSRSRSRSRSRKFIFTRTAGTDKGLTTDHKPCLPLERERIQVWV